MAPLASRQPFKGLYIAQRILTTLSLVPFWALKYTRVSARPKPTWTLRETIFVFFIRRVMHVNEVTGVMLECTDKTKEVDESTLKETSFVWIDPVDHDLVHGVAASETVKPMKIPGYIWPKGAKVKEADGYVGYWIHGGAYRMGNGGETFGPSEIAKYISKNSRIKTVLSLDYRLSGEARHPAQLLDALAGYAYLVDKCGIAPNRIVMFGDCAGTHLIMMLVRYLSDEKTHQLPGAIILLSPWLDMAYEIVNGHSIHPNSYCDIIRSSGWFPLQLIAESTPTSILASPYLSSNRAPAESFVGYPKTFISLGGAEIFVEEAMELGEKMREAGVDITIDIQPDAVHDFWAIPIVPHDKARVELKKNVLSWIDAFPPV